MVVVDNAHTQLRRVASIGRWPSENLPSKLDEIFYFESNFSPEGVCLPGYYPYLELLCALYNIQTHTTNFCEFCATFIRVPGTSVRCVRPCRNTRGTGTAFFYLPGTSVSSVRPCLNTRGTGTAFIYLPAISVSSVRPCHNTRNFWKFCKPSYPYPVLLCVL